MLSQPLLNDVLALVHKAFHDRETFSCITGSVLDTPEPDLTSDIDIVVVLPDSLPPADAEACRARFTRDYVDLHDAHRRTPDLQWPGEVLYLRDLHTGLRGAVFAHEGHQATPPPLCSRDLPYRYWLSMLATGHPTTGIAAFEHYADAAAELLTQHAIAALHPLPANHPGSETETYWATEWKLPLPGTTSRTDRLDQQLRAQTAQNITFPEARDQQPERPHPKLENQAAQWTHIALQHAQRRQTRAPTDRP